VFTVVVTAWTIGPHPALADFTFGEPVNLRSIVPALDPAYDAIDCLSYDGLELFVDSKRPGGYGDWDICVLRRATTDSEWASPENLGPAVNSSGVDSEASISADGLELYFHSGPSSTLGKGDIYLISRETKDAPWGPRMNLGAKTNSPDHDSEPWITADGLQLYFQSLRPGGYGTGDMWVATRPTTKDSWAEPVNLGPTINGPSYDGSPCLSPDGRVLFFHSYRKEGYGKVDLWMARRASVSDPWGPPVNLGPQVNGSTEEAYPRLAPDGRALYFWSGQNENFQMAIIPTCDFNADGKVDLGDLVILIENWGTSKTLCDIGPFAWGDGKVDIEDLKVFIGYWEQENVPKSGDLQ